LVSSQSAGNSFYLFAAIVYSTVTVCRNPILNLQLKVIRQSTAPYKEGVSIQKRGRCYLPHQVPVFDTPIRGVPLPAIKRFTVEYGNESVVIVGWLGRVAAVQQEEKQAAGNGESRKARKGSFHGYRLTRQVNTGRHRVCHGLSGTIIFSLVQGLHATLSELLMSFQKIFQITVTFFPISSRGTRIPHSYA